MDPQSIASVTLSCQPNRSLSAKVFIDASYDGDIMVAAGNIDYTFGREATTQYNETLAGARVPGWSGVGGPRHIKGRNKQGALLHYVDNVTALSAPGSSDQSLMAFQHRMCISGSQQRIPWPKPPHYNPQDFNLLQQAIDADANSTNFFTSMPPSRLPGVPEHIEKYCLCCGITVYSTDNPVLNRGWATANWKEKQEIIARHTYFELGSFYYLSHDSNVPLAVRNEFSKYGLCHDEFIDNAYIPHQLYVRISNRLVGDYVMTQNNIVDPLLKTDSIAVGDWSFDQHMTGRYAVPIPGSKDTTEVTLEGNFWPPLHTFDNGSSSNWYDVPYKIMVPKRNGTGRNLLVPVALSSSAVAFSSTRIENMYMSVGTAAGVAAQQLVTGEVNNVQDVNVTKVQHILTSMFHQRIHGPPQNGRGEGSGVAAVDAVEPVPPTVPPKVPPMVPPTSLLATPLKGVLPPTLPPWPPTYELAMSTLTMQCNGSGYSNATRGAAFGIVSYDWSNAKAQWSMAQPMDDEERLLHQAILTKKTAMSLNRSTKVFVYRNVVKALPWFSSVRNIMVDPAYSGFFLHFKDKTSKTSVPRCALENNSKCSMYYHDQEQTPEVNGGDGKCPPVGGCDCGKDLPCGEYLWDHRNGSQLRTWLIDHHIVSATALGNEAVDGMFIDDYWCSNLICQENPHVAGCPCGDPVQGPTEVNKNNQIDMGLSDEDVRDLTMAWNLTMGLVQEAILKNKGYTWSLLWGQGNANASPLLLHQNTCTQQLRDACRGGKDNDVWQTNGHLVGLNVVNGTQYVQLNQDVAFFQLVRGPYAWLGWGQWGMTWPFNPEPRHGELPPLPHGVPRPAVLEHDFGVPGDGAGAGDGDLCHETTSGSGIFQRLYSRGVVELNCNTFVAKW